jgi:phosphoenolpyruvate carboxylase
MSFKKEILMYNGMVIHKTPTRMTEKQKQEIINQPEKIIKKDFHICEDGEVIKYLITNHDIVRQEITTPMTREDVLSGKMVFSRKPTELMKILDKEYGI